MKSPKDWTPRTVEYRSARLATPISLASEEKLSAELISARGTYRFGDKIGDLLSDDSPLLAASGFARNLNTSGYRHELRRCQTRNAHKQSF